VLADPEGVFFLADGALERLELAVEDALGGVLGVGRAEARRLALSLAGFLGDRRRGRIVDRREQLVAAFGVSGGRNQVRRRPSLPAEAGATY